MSWLEVPDRSGLGRQQPGDPELKVLEECSEVLKSSSMPDRSIYFRRDRRSLLSPEELTIDYIKELAHLDRFFVSRIARLWARTQTRPVWDCQSGLPPQTPAPPLA